MILSTLSSWALLAAAAMPPPEARPPVVLLHGLARTPRSMRRMQRELESGGFDVCNVAYPSRHYPIETLATEFVGPAVQRCFGDRAEPVSFVTHSLGGIVVRELAAAGPPFRIGRVVMLSPPNGGSEVVDRLGRWPGFRAINGPAGLQLGTGPEAAPVRRGPVDFELGVITGRRTINPILWLLIPGPNDGKVAVARAGVEGMRDFRVVAASHAFIMRDREAIGQTLQFLRAGAFRQRAALSPAR